MIKLNNISKFYQSDNIVYIGVQDINIEFKDDGLVVIKGEIGSGKTTILNIIAGKLVPDYGTLTINNTNLNDFLEEERFEYSKKYITYLTQDYNVIDMYTVFDNVVEALELNGYKENIEEKANEIINKVGLNELSNRIVKKLSGGEKQRLSLARAIAKDDDILVFDEPTASLDYDNAVKVGKIIKELSTNKLVIVATHDLEVFGDIADREIEIRKGKLISDKVINKTNKFKLDYQEKDINNNEIGKNLFKRNLRFNFMSLILKVIILSIILFFIMSLEISEYNNKLNYSTEFNEINYLQRKDGNDFTDDEKVNLANNKNISELLDINRYIIEIDLRKWPGTRTSIYSSVEFTKKDIMFGRLPENENEIVFPQHYVELYGKTLNEDYNDDLVGMKVVGISKDSYIINEKIFFNLFVKQAYSLSRFVLYDTVVGNGAITYTKTDFQDKLLIDNSLQNDEIIVELGSNTRLYKEELFGKHNINDLKLALNMENEDYYSTKPKIKIIDGSTEFNIIANLNTYLKIYTDKHAIGTVKIATPSPKELVIKVDNFKKLTDLEKSITDDYILITDNYVKYLGYKEDVSFKIIFITAIIGSSIALIYASYLLEMLNSKHERKKINMQKNSGMKKEQFTKYTELQRAFSLLITIFLTAIALVIAYNFIPKYRIDYYGVSIIIFILYFIGFILTQLIVQKMVNKKIWEGENKK